jgi:TusE/DsrC/DsvC family sulfur relay protein
MRTLPEKVLMLKVDDREIPRDEAGFLFEPADWDKRVAETIAAEENISLNDEHWAILQFVRESFDESLITPDARLAYKFLAKHSNLSRSESRQHFYELFPYGYVTQTCRIAGMRQPRTWSTG